ncbi:MAG: hypothetical protein ABJC04_03435, partial [Verrucomicrobiota bacterium]
WERFALCSKKFMKLFFKIIGVIFFTALKLNAQTPSLFTASPSFNATNRIVSASFFTWYASHYGQLSGPWRPLEGRTNWTGEPDFWKGQIKQVMMANIDVLYVHLIPSFTPQRINFFKALNTLRSEGYDVPKVAPFLDPLISWGETPAIDAANAKGKDAIADQYVQFFNQYFSVNRDRFADDYVARIDQRVVLDTWHVHLSISNFSSLSRDDLEKRLAVAFGQHPVFSNGICMVTTSLNGPSFPFADEKVPQFEINEYFKATTYHGITSVQLKAGYWDQNVRNNPGDFLKRDGGKPYAEAWKNVDRRKVQRVYVESWNEFDEGTGIFAASTAHPYIQPGSGNTNTDLWSKTGNPFEYIDTTARGASAFNDVPDHDAKILWHNIPRKMLVGEKKVATVVVRNEGDVSWTSAANFKFGQKEFKDAFLFGPGRYLLTDTTDEIPLYKGIFRGRPKIFQITLKAPQLPGIFLTHWGMLQESVEWFGEELSIPITVSSPLEGSN